MDYEQDDDNKPETLIRFLRQPAVAPSHQSAVAAEIDATRQVLLLIRSIELAGVVLAWQVSYGHIARRDRHL